MFNYEVNIDNRHNVKLSASTPTKIAKLLWAQTLATDVGMCDIDYKEVERTVQNTGLPESIMIWTYDSEDDCEDFTIDVSAIETDDQLNSFVEFIGMLYPLAHEGKRVEILRINKDSSCNIM